MNVLGAQERIWRAAPECYMAAAASVSQEQAILDYRTESPTQFPSAEWKCTNYKTRDRFSSAALPVCARGIDAGARK